MSNDSKRKCNVCGQELSAYAFKCPNCGTIAEAKSQQAENGHHPAGIIRHPFVSFWLWLGTVLNGICVIAYFLLLFSSKGLWTGTPEPMWLRLAWLFGASVAVYGYIMLLKWKRTGFYVLSAITAMNVTLSLISDGFSISAFMPIIGISVLYSILRIKKDGIEYWEAMDLKR